MFKCFYIFIFYKKEIRVRAKLTKVVKVEELNL